jgi:uncharacterized protein involved in exopolysaccharide biosynthesis
VRGRPTAGRDVLYVAFRYHRRVLLILAIALLGAGAYTVLAMPVYRAEIRLLVKMGKESFSAVDEYHRQNYNVLFQQRAQHINNEVEIFKAGRLSDKLVQELVTRARAVEAAQAATGIGRARLAVARAIRDAGDVLFTPLYASGMMQRRSETDELIRDLRRALQAEALEDTDIIKVTYEWTDPYFAAFLLNEVMREYSELHISVHQTAKSHDFYLDQIRLHENALTDVERRLKEFTTTRSIANVGLQKELMLREISELEKRLSAVATAHEDIRTKVARVRETYTSTKEWVETPKMGLLDFSELRGLDERYFSLREERSQFRASSREAQRLDVQLESLRQQKATSLLSILETENLARANERKLLGRQLTEKRQAFDGLNAVTLTLAELERERELASANYILYKKKAEELRVSQGLDERQVISTKLIAPALPPPDPVYPRRRVILGIAAFCGLVVGVAYVLVAHALDHTFRDERDVSDILDTPVLADFPNLPARRMAAAAGRRA